MIWNRRHTGRSLLRRDQVTASVPDTESVTLPWQSVRSKIEVQVGDSKLRLDALPMVIEWDGLGLRATISSRSDDALLRLEQTSGYRMQLVRPGWRLLSDNAACIEGELPLHGLLQNPDGRQWPVQVAVVKCSRRSRVPVVLLGLLVVATLGWLTWRGASSGISRKDRAPETMVAQVVVTPHVPDQEALQVPGRARELTKEPAAAKPLSPRISLRSAGNRSAPRTVEQRLAVATLARAMQQPVDPQQLQRVVRLQDTLQTDTQLPDALTEAWRAKVRDSWDQMVANAVPEKTDWQKLRVWFDLCQQAGGGCDRAVYFHKLTGWATDRLMQLRSLESINPAAARALGETMLRALPGEHPLVEAVHRVLNRLPDD